MDHYSRSLLKFVKVVLVVTAVYWCILLSVIVCMLFGNRSASGPEGDVHASLLLFFFVVLSIGGGVLAILALVFQSVSQHYLKELDQHNGRVHSRRGIRYLDLPCWTLDVPNHLELNVGPTPLIIFNASFQRYANLHTLIPLLCQRRVLLTSDLETLLKYSERRCDQVSQLLTILDKKGMAGINGMISCLKEDKEHLGHADLAAMLKHHYHRLSPQRNC